LPKTKKVSGPAFVLAGGSVTGNAAQFIGGGIYVKGGASVFSQGKGTLSGNSAGDGEGVDIHQQP
ncbi:MAG: hypothetical protein LBD31_10585, partial [Treponema sp.]|nr:hypothetical protein [Treponema sp.]